MESSSSGLRRKDTTKGPPLRILSLDGGGVRGYSMLILLQELMYRTYVEIEGKAPKRDQIPKPCDHFDLIAGTGTGGLIAIMLGRLRLDIETCKEVYVRMTRRVFETDKTIIGIPYRSTLFKASKLEEAIQDCVKEHTIFEDEGNDGTLDRTHNYIPSPSSPTKNSSSLQRKLSRASTATPIDFGPPQGTIRWGNPNALLYDSRENRTKTAVTAMFKGSSKNSPATLLRSYDARKEPEAEFNCTIWQAGRATSATGLAFKPIQIGQSVFIDEGPGKYNPAPQILDEAAMNEWPGREVGVFLSIGTGKRPAGTSQQQQLWWEGFAGGALSDFAEAKRRLISKIEGCEATHQYMLAEHVAKRGMNPANYYRLNVEVGVGEFGMNEWSRLADISTSTRRYLAKSEVQRLNVAIAAKMARIHRMHQRLARPTYSSNKVGEEEEEEEEDEPAGAKGEGQARLAPQPLRSEKQHPIPPFTAELAGVELPATRPHTRTPSAEQQDKYAIISSDEYPQPMPYSPALPPRTPTHPRTSSSSFAPSPRRSSEMFLGEPQHPPPRPPKTPIPRESGEEHREWRAGYVRPGGVLPYPDNDGPPPVVDLARKPEYLGR
ncbi:MAG: hypothetical protein M1829_004992 [Trizodia sp. TS-e1964]|nr:MAG: hypothetical protein M1829_004992 [Trizodia sp. TS-e1964]